MGVRKGCYHCTKRRIICDMTEPKCTKCINKGLECSGNGLRYHFHDGIASRGKLRGLSIPIAPKSQSPVGQGSYPNKQVGENKSTAAKRPCTSQLVSARSGSDNNFEARILPCLESTDSHTRLLLDHLSIRVAADMVILDGKDNGYRHLILPLAVQDNLVQKAVTSVAGLHLSHLDPALRCAAENGRAEVIKQLKQASMAPGAKIIFNVSNWTTVLVLLIGELVLGGDQYPYLLRMLSSLKANVVFNPNPELVQFLSLQTELITVLAQPFINTSNHVADSTPEESLESILLESQGQNFRSAGREIIQTVVEASLICHGLYRDRARSLEHHDKFALEHLKQLVSQIPPCTAVGNSLVWIYFIGAADSDTMEQRVFFTRRLEETYIFTGWAHIAAGLLMLEQLWRSPHEASWARILPGIATTFIM